MPYVVYIVRNAFNKLYIGHSSNLQQRILDHKTGKGAEFVKVYRDFELIYFEKYSSQIEAMRREKQLKGWTRAKKEALIADNKELLKKL